MNTPFVGYYQQLYEAVLDCRRVDYAPLAFTEKIHKAIQPYLRDEYQRPQPPLRDL
jgi:hypothetical protein